MKKLAQFMSISASCLICINHGLQILEKIHVNASHHQFHISVGAVDYSIIIESKANPENKASSVR